MKKQAGMSHITLILTVLVIIVIAIVGTRIILKENKNRKIENVTTNMLLVQGKIKVIAQENEMNKDENTLIGKKVSENLEDEKVKILIENKVISQDEENFDKHYIIDSETLNELNLKDNLNGEYYIVNYKTYEVIYSKGIEIDGKMHHALTELLEHRDIKEQNIQATNEGKINAEQINAE